MTSKNPLKNATQERNQLCSTGSELSEVDYPEEEQSLMTSYDPDAIIGGMFTFQKCSCLFMNILKLVLN